jgi:EAL domain-containing protein (putative c-di-GMP-specific phosphodiesterase class I)
MSLIKETLLNTQFPPELLVLELTESSIMSASQLIEQTIQDIAAMRIGISLDDFGTGYSSLSHLKRFTISTLKIDRSFVEDMTLSTNNNLVVKSILALSHILKLDVIAEGIETEEQLQLLLKNKCQYGQGFYFSKPITDDEMGLLLHRERDMDHKKKPQSNEP